MAQILERGVRFVTQRRGGGGDLGIALAPDFERPAVQGDHREPMGERVVELACEEFALGLTGEFGSERLTALCFEISAGFDGLHPPGAAQQGAEAEADAEREDSDDDRDDVDGECRVLRGSRQRAVAGLHTRGDEEHAERVE